MSAAHPHRMLVDAMHALLRRLDTPLVNDFLASWPAVPVAGQPARPAAIPVLRWIDTVCADSAPFAAEFTARLAAAGAALAWRRSYSASSAGEAFLNGYGYCELVGPGAPVVSLQLAAGVLLLGPHIDYPAHWHEAEELYVPLAGTAAWWQGVKSWAMRRPGEVIHHARHEPHAMRTAHAPLLALYVWRSTDLAQKAQLVSAPAHQDEKHRP